MMNAYEKAKQLTAKWEQERKDSKRLATMKEAERRIQVREFDNMLCLSLDGILGIIGGAVTKVTKSS